MVLNRILLAGAGPVLFGLTALGLSGVASAQQYRADEFLNLDLSRAVLSPKPLGPAAGFAPGPLDVTMDRGKEAAAASTSAELVVDPKTVPAATVHAEKAATPRSAISAARIARARVERAPQHKPHTLVALHGRNPMEAQARDTSVQVWPCRSGGICNWKR